ncbi:hypothetical protein Tco_1410215 [Tanacetum coccineum]
MSDRIAEAATLSPSSFCKRYRSSYKTSSSSSSPPTLTIWKRYRSTSKLVEDTKDESSDSDTHRERESLEGEGHSSEDEGPGSEDEDEPLGLGNGALRHRELALGEGSVPNAFEVGQSSRSVLEYEGAERISAFRQPTLVTWTSLSPEWSSGSLPVSPSPIASPVTTPAATISVDKDQFLEVGAQLELHGSILHDHIQRLDALPPTLFEGYDQDLRDLYTRSGAVRDEIFSHKYRFRSLEREQERATVTISAIWRPILALKAWAGQTDSQRAALWHAIYDI